PAEEGSGGALPMINEGVMENPRVDGAFGLHVEPLEKTGNIQIKDGSIMASPDDFKITIQGTGGHGAYPEKSVNPLTVAAKILERCHAIPKKYDLPCVVTVCEIHGGTARNIIPASVIMTGTARSLDSDTRVKLNSLIREIAQTTAEEYGAAAELDFSLLFPTVVNDAGMNAIVRKGAEKLSCVKKIITLEKPSMIGDDFAYFAKLVPSAYFRLGVGNADMDAVYPLHSPKFKADENALPIGVSVLVQSAADFLDTFNV
ncbi:MAG: amidohydrolase, partial [Clostridia bacterium]|nr:amidohydrolase [Clostridia bacterium]